MRPELCDTMEQRAAEGQEEGPMAMWADAREERGRDLCYLNSSVQVGGLDFQTT